LPGIFITTCAVTDPLGYLYTPGTIVFCGMFACTTCLTIMVWRMPPDTRILASFTEIAVFLFLGVFVPVAIIFIFACFHYASVAGINPEIVLPTALAVTFVVESTIFSAYQWLPNMPMEASAAHFLIFELTTFTAQRSYVSALDDLSTVALASAVQSASELAKAVIVLGSMHVYLQFLKRMEGMEAYLIAGFTHKSDMFTDVSAEILSIFVAFAARISSDSTLFGASACSGAAASVSFTDLIIILLVQLSFEVVTDFVNSYMAQKALGPHDYSFLTQTTTAVWLLILAIGVSMYTVVLGFQFQERSSCVFCELQAEGDVCTP